MRIVWEGPFARPLSLDKVNREMTWAMLQRGHEVLPVSLTPSAEPPFTDPLLSLLTPYFASRQPAEAHVRMRWPPHFDDRCGPLYLWQPWEYGAVPDAWIPEIERWVARVVVPSEAVRTMYLRSGVAHEKVVVVPHGVNPGIYNPWGPRLNLPGLRGSVLLFVGGLIHRKGFDVVLEAYRQAFTSADDVTLVVKTVGSRGVYDDTAGRRLLAKFLSDRKAPHIVVLEQDLDESQMAALYRRADIFVAPFRGEGFGLPILEALACGTFVMASDTPPATEFLSSRIAQPVPGSLRPFRVTGASRMGWLFEPDAATLAELMRRWVAASPSERRRRTEAAVRVVHRHHTWAAAAAVFEAVLTGLEVGHPDKSDEGAGPEEPTAWLSYFEPGERVLDLGGSSDFLEALAANGIDTVAVEDDLHRLRLIERRGFPVLPGPLAGTLADLARREAGTFDGVTLRRTLTDLAPLAPEDALALIRDLLRPGGRLLLLEDRGAGHLGQRFPAAGADRSADLHVVATFPWPNGRSFVASIRTEADGVGSPPGAVPDARPAPSLIWMGPVRNASGLAEEARDVLFHLPGLGWRAHVVDLSGGYPSSLTPDEERRVADLESLSVPWDALCVQNVPPNAFVRRRRGLDVGRAVLETDRVPQAWRARLQAMDALVVPTEFARDVLVSEGLPEGRVFVLPEAVDAEVFRPTPGEGPDPEVFTLLSVFDWNERKGWRELVRAFALAFDRRDPVRLILKVTRFHQPTGDLKAAIFREIEAVGKSPSACAPIFLDETLRSRAELAALYRRAHVFVLPTRGEGWGRPIVEAMASGVPPLVPHWSAPACYLSEATSIPLRFRLEEVPKDCPFPAYRGGRWAVTDVDDLVDKMRWCHDHPEALREIGRKARLAVASWTPSAVAARWSRLLGNLVGIDLAAEEPPVALR